MASTTFKKTFALWFWGIIALGIVSIIVLFWMITKGWLGYLPPLDELQNPKNKFATEVISSDMQLLGRYYRNENRVSVAYTDISPNMINALIATEDVRFYDHTGVDVKSLMRAIIMLGKAGGGSTITQQLAKQLWSPRANNIFERALQKPIEWVIATKLERLYSKEEILTMYLNQFDFLYNAVGIKSAAQVYFSTTPANLKIEEAPYRNPLAEFSWATTAIRKPLILCGTTVCTIPETWHGGMKTVTTGMWAVPTM